MDHKTLYLLRGCPGAGKTTLANNLVALHEAVGQKASNHAADDWFYEKGPNPGVYEFNVKAMGFAHKTCQSRVERDMKDNFGAVIVSNTLTTQKEINPYTKLAEENGYRVVSLVVENRHGNKSVHNVTEDRLEIMADRFTYKLL